MIHSVTGKLMGEQLGVTLMHEHITWDRGGANSTNTHTTEEVVNTMLPHLLDLKKAGCDTFVDATTDGSGRSLEILKECSRRSGLNILTNIGAWDGSHHQGKFIPDKLKEKTIDEIVEFWNNEFINGMEGTTVKPAYIKIALGDTGEITDLQERLLRAACRTSLLTKLPIQCHTIPALSVLSAVKIIEDEGLAPNKFIWVHGDVEQNVEIIISLLKKDIWVEFDFIGRCNDYQWYVDIFNQLDHANLLNRVLISQDAGAFYYGEENTSIIPYDKIFKVFIPYCVENGISKDLFQKLLVTNPQMALEV